MMADNQDSGVVTWLRENAWNLVVTTFLVASAYGANEVKNSWRDATVATNKAGIEKIEARTEVSERNVAQITYQQATDHSSILSLTSDSKQLQINGAKLEAQLDVVNTKLDNIQVQISKLSAKMDQGQGK
jgi:phosphoribosyl-dephospho-CoA transferase